jgi:hypothetical protein
MVTAERTKKNHLKQNGLLALLNMTIAGMLLVIPALAQAEGDGIPLHGFADVGFSAQSFESPDNKGFNVGSLDLYLTPQFGDNVRSLIEIIFETLPSGELATDMERAQMGYAFSDKATVWAGRFHTPYGYWNNAFHHGAQMQTSILRPRFIDFEDKGGILPSHMVGLWATGKVRAGDGRFTYDVFAGNGPQLDLGSVPGEGVLTINTAGDNNHQAMVGMKLGYEFSGMADGLGLAVHMLRGDVDELNPPALPGNNTELSMAGGSVVYLANDWEVVGEYYRFSNKDKSGVTGSHNSWADFLQVGKNFDGLTPYLRAEKTVLDQTDNYFSQQASGQSYARQALGLKYDLNPKAALKFELLNSKFETDATHVPGSSYRSFLAQYAIRF